MRHGDKVNNLGRTAPHRRALLSNMAASLILHKRIQTTTAKAKALRVYVEPLITRSKDNTTHNRRTVFSYLQDKEASKELFDVVGPKVGERPGGYTRIIRLGARLGDAAEISIIELVDFNEVYTTDKKATAASATKKRTRRSSAKDKVADAPVKSESKKNVVEEIQSEDVTNADENHNTPEQPTE